RDGKILARTGRFVQYHDPIGIWVRQRPQQNGIYDAEDGSIGANTERKGQHRDKSECRLFCQHSQGVTKILEHRAHDYSLRKAMTGSTMVARRAGTKQAKNATAVKINVTTNIVGRSVAPMPKSRLRSNRVLANTPTKPSRRPAPTKRIPCTMTRRSTSYRWAAGARRNTTCA